jgi:hypothetical protein
MPQALELTIWIDPLSASGLDLSGFPVLAEALLCELSASRDGLESTVKGVHDIVGGHAGLVGERGLGGEDFRQLVEGLKVILQAPTGGQGPLPTLPVRTYQASRLGTARSVETSYAHQTDLGPSHLGAPTVLGGATSLERKSGRKIHRPGSEDIVSLDRTDRSGVPQGKSSLQAHSCRQSISRRLAL